VNPGRHRNSPEKEAEIHAEDHELTSYLAALAPETPNESTGTGKRFGDAQVYQLRVSLAASEQLKDIALERNTSAQRLAQEWILERLSWESSQAESEHHLRPRQAPIASPALEETEQHFFSSQWDQPPVSRL